jgi:hypothetical protein
VRQFLDLVASTDFRSIAPRHGTRDRWSERRCPASPSKGSSENSKDLGSNVYSPSDQDDDDGLKAISWFDQQLAPGEWINRSWIGGNGGGQLRILDVVCADSTHRLLWRIVPSDGGLDRIDDLSYEELQVEVERILEVAARAGIWVGEFAGAVTSVPGLTDALGPVDRQIE